MLRIYDNGGRSLDRYTCVYGKSYYQNGHKIYDAIGFSENPTHSHGFYQHTSAQLGRHLGKIIKLSNLPESARTVLEDELREIGELE